MNKPKKKTSQTSGPRTKAMNQATFNTLPISPPPADRRYPHASMKTFNGTKEEVVVVAVLRDLLPTYASNPFKAHSI